MAVGVRCIQLVDLNKKWYSESKCSKPGNIKETRSCVTQTKPDLADLENVSFEFKKRAYGLAKTLMVIRKKRPVRSQWKSTNIIRDYQVHHYTTDRWVIQPIIRVTGLIVDTKNE